MLHKVEEHEINKYRCQVCGENAVFYDDGKKLQTTGGTEIEIGTNQGLVYATCDHCKKIVCANPELRPVINPITQKFVKATGKNRIQRARKSLPDKYNGSISCLQEAVYFNHMGNSTLIQCCHDDLCVRNFEDDLRQKRVKTMQVGAIKTS